MQKSVFRVWAIFKPTLAFTFRWALFHLLCARAEPSASNLLSLPVAEVLPPLTAAGPSIAYCCKTTESPVSLGCQASGPAHPDSLHVRMGEGKTPTSKISTNSHPLLAQSSAVFFKLVPLRLQFSGVVPGATLVQLSCHFLR